MSSVTQVPINICYDTFEAIPLPHSISKDRHSFFSICGRFLLIQVGGIDGEHTAPFVFVDMIVEVGPFVRKRARFIGDHGGCRVFSLAEIALCSNDDASSIPKPLVWFLGEISCHDLVDGELEKRGPAQVAVIDIDWRILVDAGLGLTASLA